MQRTTRIGFEKVFSETNRKLFHDILGMIFPDEKRAGLTFKEVAFLQAKATEWNRARLTKPAVTKCGEDNPPWGFLVPGVHFIEDEPQSEADKELAQLISQIVN